MISIWRKKTGVRPLDLYFEEVNREPIVYRWTYKMDEISVVEAVEAGVKSSEEVCAS